MRRFSPLQGGDLVLSRTGFREGVETAPTALPSVGEIASPDPFRAHTGTAQVLPCSGRTGLPSTALS